jgi:F-type H+-transporting ATPase subunit alpha
LSVSPAEDEWLARSRAALKRATPGPAAQMRGRVEGYADGIARVSGLPDLRLNEMLLFDGAALGFALTLGAEGIEAVLLDHVDEIAAGAPVTALERFIDVPVGPGLLGRVVDALGRPLDGGGPLVEERRAAVERAAPAIIERDLVSKPLQTGVLAIDAMFALGRGQRELIIGDRGTGKTSLALDAIINQRASDVVCVYVAVGQPAAAVERAIAAVRAHGAPERCVFVTAAASAPAAQQWIAPFAGFAIAEYFRDKGGDALIVIDDLSKHAATHRELALLTHEPPGREAYPGDIFYLHARLLERAAKLSPERGGGSLTALPIAETDAGNLAAYIPTNLISITDGQIVLDARQFAANQRPAIDVGLSVSRVGGKAQPPALRALAGRLRLDYAQFQELETFTRFGGLSDARVRAEILRGERIRELLRQPRFAPLRLADQAALIAAMGEGVFDDQPAQAVAAARKAIGGRLDVAAPDLVKDMGAMAQLPPEARRRLVQAAREAPPSRRKP